MNREPCENHTDTFCPTGASSLASTAMNSSQPNGGIFTALQIARASGISRQAVHSRLKSIEETSVWRFDELPFDWQQEITRRAVKRGFQEGTAFLAGLPLVPWRSPLPWDKVSPKEQAKAEKLKSAMRRALTLRGEGVKSSELEQIGMADYQVVFGYPLKDSRHWRRLLVRTVDRDGGEENWEAPELYLDDRAFIIAAPRRNELCNEYQHRDLDEVFDVLENRESPTAEDRAMLWDAVFAHYEELVVSLPDSTDGNRERRLIKVSLVSYLFRAFPGSICATVKSLRNRFDEKFEQWRAGGRAPQALIDKRSENSGKTGRKLCVKCRPILIGAAVELDGDLSQAWRRLQLGGKLCAECAEIGSFDVRRNKSEVPKTVRADVTPDIQDAVIHRRGPRHARLQSPYVRRNWSDIGPGDWAECDDMTPNHVTHGSIEVLTWDNDKSGHPYVGRMEVLVQIDRRTDYPWAYLIIMGDPATSLAPQRKATYSSVHCRLLFLHGHDRIGLPHSGGGFYLENSVWASRLIDGEQMQCWSSNPWQRTEMGLKDPRIGLKVCHALPGNPRSKVIERVFLSVQNRMRCQPGFVGFNERTDKREVMEDFIRRVKSGKEHPGNQVPEVSVFRKLLDGELMAHATEVQNGDRLPGVSPIEAFHNGIDGHKGIKDRPLRNLGASARFLLSTHERLVPVTDKGVTFKVGGTEFVFWGDELKPFKHRQVIARFNFEEPELLTCQGPDGQPFTMKARTLPSTTATKEQLAESGRDRASWMRSGKVLFDNLPHPLRTFTINDNEQNDETKALGRFHNSEMEQFKAEKTEKSRKLRKARAAAAAMGADRAVLERHPERVTMAYEMRRKAEQLRQEEKII